MAIFTSKKSIVDRLKNQIEVRDNTAIHTLMFIYGRQSSDEQEHRTVKYRNHIGFKPQDAKVGTSLAQWYETHGKFSDSQIQLVKHVVKKYAGQVVSSKISSGDIRKVGKEWIWV